MIKKIASVCLAALLLLSLSGCIKTVELNQRAIVQAIGVDLDGDQFVITLQVFNTEGTNQGNVDFTKLNNTIIKSEGITIADALHNAALQQGQETFYAHNGLLIIGRQAAERGILPILDFFNTDRRARPNTEILIADGKAEQVVSAQINQGILPAELIENITETNQSNGKIHSVTLLELMRVTQNGGGDAFAPLIQTFQNEEGEDSVRFLGTALFHQEKLSGELNSVLTRGFLFATRKMDKTLIPIEVQEYGRVSIEVVKSDNSITSQIVDGRPHFHIEVHCKGVISEVMTGDKQRGLRLEDIPMLETQLSAEVRRQVEASIQQSVYACGSDIFELGAHLWKQHPDFWMANRDNWDALLPTSTFTVEVSSEIEKVGSELRFSKNGQ